MGSVAGKTASQESGLTPEYDVLGQRDGYELRAYRGYVVAEVEAGTEPGMVNEDELFRTLAKYIGVFGNPLNKSRDGDKAEKIDMTAPVVIGSPSLDPGAKISMTAPVVQTPGSAKTMQFVMPQKFKSISDLPTPTDERVKLREVREHVYLVRQFSGNMGSGDGHDATAELERFNTEKFVKADGGAFADYVGADAKFLIARYNPPWTLPFLKTNELWFPLPLSREEAVSKLPATSS